jgi:hypothetical protein
VSYSSERYWARKLAGKCVSCGAGLPDDASTVRCVECAELVRASALRWRKNNPERAAESANAWLRRHPEHVRARNRASYQARKLAGICVHCTQPALDESVYCEKHRDAKRTSSLNVWRRKNGKAAPPPKPHAVGWSKQRKPMRRARQLNASRETEPMRVLESLRFRLLSALQRMEWPMASEIFEAARVCIDGESREYDSAIHMLTRFVREGKAERRNVNGHYEYRITEAGKAAVEDALALTRRAFDAETRRAA